MKIQWEEKEGGLWLGKINGDVVCKISEHWTGFWLDGYDSPYRCPTLEMAKQYAESITIPC